MRILLLVLLGCLTSSEAFAQKDTSMYFKTNGLQVRAEAYADIRIDLKYLTKDKIEYRRYVESDPKEKKLFMKTDKDKRYMVITTLKSDFTDTSFRQISQKGKQFLIKEYTKEGTLTDEGISEHPFVLIKEGTWNRYYESGGKKAEEYYKNNVMYGNLRWKEDGAEALSNVFLISDSLPKFDDAGVSFTSYIAKKVHYPSEAVKADIEGVVYVEFVVTENGDVAEIALRKSVHPSLDAEVLRVIKSLNKKWIPGKIDDKPVRVMMVQPLNFLISD